MIYQDLLDDADLTAYARSLNSRAKALDITGRVSAVELRDCILQSGGRCAWCAVNLVGAEFELDHIISLRQGGANTVDNLTVSCPNCNRRKSQSHPARFAQESMARLGAMTPLLKRLFDFYDIQPTVQRSLFDAPLPTDALLDADEADDEENPPVYRW